MWLRDRRSLTDAPVLFFTQKSLGVVKSRGMGSVIGARGHASELQLGCAVFLWIPLFSSFIFSGAQVLRLRRIVLSLARLPRIRFRYPTLGAPATCLNP